MSELNIDNLATITTPSTPATQADAGMIVIKRSTVMKMILPLAPAVSIAMACLLGLVMLTSFGIASFLPEMTAAAVVNTLGGIMSIGVLLMVADKGAAVISRTALMATAIRMAGVLMGSLMAMGPGWGLHTKPLLFWVLCLYFVMLITESWVAIWLESAGPNTNKLSQSIGGQLTNRPGAIEIPVRDNHQ